MNRQARDQQANAWTPSGGGSARPPISAAGSVTPPTRPVIPAPPEIAALFEAYDPVTTPPVPRLESGDRSLGAHALPTRTRPQARQDDLTREEAPRWRSFVLVVGSWLAVWLLTVVTMALPTGLRSSHSNTASMTASVSPAAVSDPTPDAWRLDATADLDGVLVITVTSDQGTPWISEVEVELKDERAVVRFAIPVRGGVGSRRLVIGSADPAAKALVPGSYVRVHFLGDDRVVVVKVPEPGSTPTPPASADPAPTGSEAAPGQSGAPKETGTAPLQSGARASGSVSNA